MVKAREIINYIEKIAPPRLQSDTDNSGLQLGNPDKDVEVLCVAYEKDLKTIRRAISKKCDMLVTHRPLFLPKRFPVSHTTFFDKVEKLLLEQGILLYSAHESWDLAEGGTSDSLARHLGITVILSDRQYRIGTIRPVNFKEFAVSIKNRLSPALFLAIGNPRKTIRKIGFVPGTALEVSDIEFFIGHRVDCYLCGDPDDFGIRYCRDSNLCVVNVDDYSIERPGMIELTDRLKKSFKNLSVFLIEDRIQSI